MMVIIIINHQIVTEVKVFKPSSFFIQVDGCNVERVKFGKVVAANLCYSDMRGGTELGRWKGKGGLPEDRERKCQGIFDEMPCNVVCYVACGENKAGGRNARQIRRKYQCCCLLPNL